MNKLVSAIKADETVKYYLYLRSIIESNKEYSDILKSDLSLNKAKISNSSIENVINEYIEVEKMVKNDLEMICNIINSELDINFLV